MKELPITAIQTALWAPLTGSAIFIGVPDRFAAAAQSGFAGIDVGLAAISFFVTTALVMLCPLLRGENSAEE